MTGANAPGVRCTLWCDNKATDDTWSTPLPPANAHAAHPLLRHLLAQAIRGHGSAVTPAARARYSLDVVTDDRAQTPLCCVRLENPA